MSLRLAPTIALGGSYSWSSGRRRQSPMIRSTSRAPRTEAESRKLRGPHTEISRWPAVSIFLSSLPLLVRIQYHAFIDQALQLTKVISLLLYGPLQYSYRKSGRWWGVSTTPVLIDSQRYSPDLISLSTDQLLRRGRTKMEQEARDAVAEIIKVKAHQSDP